MLGFSKQNREIFRAKYFIPNGEDHFLLPAGAGNITFITLAITCIGKRHISTQSPHPTTGKDHLILPGTYLIQSQSFIVRDMDPTDQVNEFHKGIKVNLGIILDRHPQKLFYGLAGEFRTTSGQF